MSAAPRKDSLAVAREVQQVQFGVVTPAAERRIPAGTLAFREQRESSLRSSEGQSHSEEHTNRRHILHMRRGLTVSKLTCG